MRFIVEDPARKTVIGNGLSLTMGKNGLPADSAQTLGRAWRVLHMTLHSSKAMHANDVLTVTLDSKFGAEYDGVLLSQAMAALTDLLWIPTNDLIFSPDDDIVIACTNLNQATLGLIVMWAIVYGGP